MRNWITTVCGILAGVPTLLNALGISIPDGISGAVTAIMTALLGVFAADAVKT